MGPLLPVAASFVNGRLPSALEGTQVLFDGEAAPLISVQATGILAIAPNDVASKSKVTMTVQNQGSTASVVLNAAPAAPGIFLYGDGQAAAVNEDGSLNSVDHPAPSASIVALFLTGTGLTNPPTLDGVPPTPPLSPLALPVSAKIGGVSAEIVYAGAVSGFPGMAQVNIRVPAIPISNAAPVEVTVGGITRNQTVSIAVQ